MSDAYTQVPPDSTGDKIDMESLTVGGETVHRQRVQLAGATAAQIAAVLNANPSTEYGVVVRSLLDALISTSLAGLSASGLVVRPVWPGFTRINMHVDATFSVSTPTAITPTPASGKASVITFFAYLNKSSGTTALTLDDGSGSNTVAKFQIASNSLLVVQIPHGLKGATNSQMTLLSTSNTVASQCTVSGYEE